MVYDYHSLTYTLGVLIVYVISLSTYLVCVSVVRVSRMETSERRTFVDVLDEVVSRWCKYG